MPPAERFWLRVRKTDTCWLWQAATTNGYGVVKWDGRLQHAHRVAYRLLVGPIPTGLQLDHLCRVRGCVRPDHLEPVPQLVNMQRGANEGASAWVDSVCKNGHQLTLENTYVYRKARACKQCNRDRALAYYHRKKAQG